jgi:hypothetical protein
VFSVYQDGETLRIYRHAVITGELGLLRGSDVPEPDTLKILGDERNS